MKKRLLIAIISLLCLVMTCAVVFTALSMASDKQTNAGGLSFDLLADEVAPTFKTTTPKTLLTPNMLTNTTGANNISSVEVIEDYVHIVPGISDPFYYPLANFTAGRYVVYVYRANDCGNTTTQFFMGSYVAGPSDDSSMLETNVISDGQWQTYIFDTQSLIDAEIFDGQTAQYFRFDILEAGYKLNENGESYKEESGSWAKEPIPEGATIDFKCVAFFDTLADAEGFDIDQYNAKIAYEEEQKRLAEEEAKKNQWPDVEFKDMDTTDYDLSDGTLKYTYSEDGSTVTISYEVNGETRSYTVPNNKNLTAGGFAATDDLDRTLYTSEQVGLYGDNGEHYVGLFYFMWQGEHGDSGVFDLQKIIDEVGVEAAGNTSCGKYGPVGAMHWFAEPLYGYYYANDAWVQRKHAELLCNINIDFLYFDTTNGYSYIHNAIQLMEILHQLNEEGYDAPQVVFYTNSSAENVVREVYNKIYSKNLYPDTWFCMNGKPVIIAPESANINDFFLTKQNQWPNEADKKNGWPWMDFQWPSRLYPSSYDFDGAAISVSVAQHSGTVAFSDSSLYGNHTNRGRSFTNPDGVESKRQALFNRVLKSAYDAWQADQSLTNQGLNFQAQWDRAIESEAMYVLVTGWNEWVAQRQPTEGGRIWFVDTSSMEFSRDTEMMRGGYFDNYYIQLAYNVQKLNGTAPIVVQDARKAINVTGAFDQWDDVTVTYSDPTGDTVERNATGFGRTKYTNDTGRNDIVGAKVATDSKNVHFYVETKDNLTMYDTNSSWMQLYVDVDSSAETGWYGYDFIINYAAKDHFTTTVAKYNGTDGAYGFEVVGEVSYQAKNNQMMITVPMELLGIEGYKEICMQFKWADSKTTYDEMEDFYIDGDCAPLGRLNYVYQNYIPGVSEITYPEDETTAPETETPTEPTTDAPVVTDAPTAEVTEAPAESETQPADGGCASVASLSALAIMGLIALGGVMLRKRED
ncbi:MAG: hypothetical protein IJW00_10810 [Clostridia bacterium]|nr:hypothetical protein [Clostridia bacterium]